MTRPLVERLRDDAQNEDIASCAEAADEIERLRTGIQKHIDSYQAYDYCDVQEMRDLLSGAQENR
jgi:hypothetical protein